jgi:hypothetical protein
MGASEEGKRRSVGAEGFKKSDSRSLEGGRRRQVGQYYFGICSD